ncbi:hypothetical protein ACVT81_004251 [Yersinia enterocolitica]|uniref:hypothetical protein n=1 Tax=Yersiniaceae TaxID=1903411 RepID=UPI001B029CFD|nr:hypothetical protein [Yersinia intermedia]EKN3891437.1 hypothetical protein [Yersinia enterocolitica]HBA4338117.1 hypothetical protein [Escherichia coli]HBE9082557.1 hypothetical protein [Serratia fonticola]EKN3944442.1 hypothetical protein [Yersinia enterocolitica]EKN4176319.1 hypothetical protein [Yersinia enterocolitica]
MNEKGFRASYQAVFEVVCRILGDGWRVNRIDDCLYRIKLTSHFFKNYSVHIRMDKNRLTIVGNVDCRSWRSPCHSCTVSPQRNPIDIARDIQRKILVTARQEVEQAINCDKERRDKREQERIVKGMLAQQVQLTPHYNTLTGFKTMNGIHGTVTENHSGYGVNINGLTTDQLIKMVGFISIL